MEELMAYGKEIGLSESDGEGTFWKWEANGWTNGGNPIKDWKLTFLAWKTHGYFPSQKNPKPSEPVNMFKKLPGETLAELPNYMQLLREDAARREEDLNGEKLVDEIR